MKKLLFYVGLAIILIFYCWSKLILFSLILLVVVDGLTIQIIYNRLKKTFRIVIDFLLSMALC